MLALVASLLPAAASAQQAPEGTHSDTMEFVANLPYGDRFGLDENYGTDSDFITMPVDGELRSVGVFGSIHNGAFIMDVTDGVPEELGWYSCGIGQGDVQVFQRGEGEDVRTYFTFTDDGYSRAGLSDCVVWGEEHRKFSETREGSYIVDITDPSSPQTVNFVPFPLGSHNQTVHPSGDYLYNSNSELITNIASSAIEIWDITDLDAPVQLESLAIPPVPASLGNDSHDITFNADGTRAYSAALSQTLVIDTTDPANPSIIGTVVDPTINVHHQANNVTIDDPLLGEQEFLLIEDEFAGAVGPEPQCPSGGVHVYNITGELEAAPVKVGYWNLGDPRLKSESGLKSCTAHVFDIHEDAAIMTISYYDGGVRVVDLSGLVGVAVGGQGAAGMRELGYYYFDDSNSWSVKTDRITVDEDGTLDFFLYSDDINRGLDVFRFHGARAAAGTGADVWLTPEAAAVQLAGVTMPDTYRPFCLLRDRGVTGAPTLASLTLI